MQWMLLSVALALQLVWVLSVEVTRARGTSDSVRFTSVTILAGSALSLAAAHQYGDQDLVDALWVGVALLVVFLEAELSAVGTLATAGIVLIELLLINVS